MKSKEISIIAHITIIGWVIALVMNNKEKSDLATFYIRQMFGLIAISFAIYILALVIPVLGILQLGTLVLWILSIIGAVNEEKKETPILGAMFQDWFSFL